MSAHGTGQISDDHVRELFYEAIESFPAEARERAELWLYEREVANIFLQAVEGLASIRHRRGRAG
jgi:hypothetical protein